MFCFRHLRLDGNIIFNLGTVFVLTVRLYIDICLTNTQYCNLTGRWQVKGILKLSFILNVIALNAIFQIKQVVI